MKTFFCSGTLLCAFLFGPAMSIFGQGSLTPLAAPTPTMKSLDQIEARTPIDPTQPGFLLPYTISSSGSYYLTANVTAAGSDAGIIILADDVTVDLNGFALIGGGGGTVRGVDVPAAQKNICIRNGTVRGWTDGGVRLDNGTNSLLAMLRVSDNSDASASGTAAGLVAGAGSTVSDCVATGNAVAGIGSLDNCIVVGCTASGNAGRGFNLGSNVMLTQSAASNNAGTGIVIAANGSVVHCTASSNSGGAGIAAGVGCTVDDCTAGGNGSDGVDADVGSTVRNCTSRFNGGDGIFVTSNCLVVGNTCDENSQAGAGSFSGLHVLSSGHANHIEGNSCTFNNGIGFYVAGSNNLIFRNSARGNQGFNYRFGPQNTFGPIVIAPGTNAQEVNDGTFQTRGGNIGSTDPYANIFY